MRRTPYRDYARYVEASGIDSVTQYELWKAIWSSLNDQNLFELAHTLKRHAELLPTFLPQIFLRNYDLTRIASRLDDDRHIACVHLPVVAAEVLAGSGTSATPTAARPR